MRSTDILTKRARRLLDALPPAPRPRPEYVPPQHDAQRLQAFLSIDERSLPESADPDRQTRPQTQYRSDRWRVLYHLQQNRVCDEDLAIVHRWTSGHSGA